MKELSDILIFIFFSILFFTTLLFHLLYAYILSWAYIYFNVVHCQHLIPVQQQESDFRDQQGSYNQTRQQVLGRSSVGPNGLPMCYKCGQEDRVQYRFRVKAYHVNMPLNYKRLPLRGRRSATVNKYKASLNSIDKYQDSWEKRILYIWTSIQDVPLYLLSLKSNVQMEETCHT